ncbi:FAD-dependent oxidoreductase [Hwanghaeella sp.]|uniref:FAD-dependent oxidoreductase n=1 Tax=Hwanghaeella sp. TaxID=2605943 RepID=UPI003CCBFD5B
MAQTALFEQEVPVSLPEKQIVVVGGGPVGMRAAQQIAGRGVPVTVLTAETYEPYNRVQLTPLLAGDVQFGEIGVPRAKIPDGHFTCETGCHVIAIDRDAHEVQTADGRCYPYSTLILATGSHAHVPNIPGRDLSGVFTFRTAADAAALLARSLTARDVVVIGGGLLGLEAARGMQRRQASVTVIEHENRLMPRQLDLEASAVLQGRIEELDVAVVTGTAVKEIAGELRVQSVRLADGREVACDTVIICTGVRANTRLAYEAGLPISRGILVDDGLRTADPMIYAIGECAQHRDRIYGLVGPGYEQADLVAKAIAGTPSAYPGSVPATKLKVIGAELFSVGEVEQLEQFSGTQSHIWRDGDRYRRIFITAGKLSGAISVGGWEQSSQVQNAVQTGGTVYPWMVARFRRTGQLWPTREIPVAELPGTAIVCNCTGVTRGRLGDAMRAGAVCAEDLTLSTGAGSVCGSCTPLLEELIDAGAPPKPVRLFKPVLACSAVAGIAALALVLSPRIPFPVSFDADSLRSLLWRDNIAKQWTGYILLGLTVAAMLIGLRKRFRFMDRLGSFDIWRLVHLGIGALVAGALFVHTGFRPGANLTLALFVAFTATLVFGAVAGLATGGDHSLRARKIGTARKPPRTLPTWAHIIALWLVPALLLVHVLTVYAF